MYFMCSIKARMRTTALQIYIYIGSLSNTDTIYFLNTLDQKEVIFICSDHCRRRRCGNGIRKVAYFENKNCCCLNRNVVLIIMDYLTSVYAMLLYFRQPVSTYASTRVLNFSILSTLLKGKQWLIVMKNTDISYLWCSFVLKIYISAAIIGSRL